MSPRKVQRTLSDEEIEVTVAGHMADCMLAADSQEMTAEEALYFWECVHAEATRWVNGLREDIKAGRVA